MAAHQAPPSLGFSRQEHWSRLPFPSPFRSQLHGFYFVSIKIPNPNRTAPLVLMPLLPHVLGPTLGPGPHSRSLASKMLLTCILLLASEMLFPRCPCTLHQHQAFAQRSSSVKAPVGAEFEITLPASNTPSLSH